MLLALSIFVSFTRSLWGSEATSNATPVAQPTTVTPAVSASAESAKIVRSRSTNQAGYSIIVTRTGSATVQIGDVVQTRAIPLKLAQQLYRHLDAAGNLDRLPAEVCMKSASFGTTTSIEYRGQTSPDLQCATSHAETILASDVDAIAAQALSGMAQKRYTLPVRIARPPQNTI